MVCCHTTYGRTEKLVPIPPRRRSSPQFRAGYAQLDDLIQNRDSLFRLPFTQMTFYYEYFQFTVANTENITQFCVTKFSFTFLRTREWREVRLTVTGSGSNMNKNSKFQKCFVTSHSVPTTKILCPMITRTTL